MTLLVGSLAIDLALSSCGTPILWQRVTINEPIKSEDVAFIIPGRTTFSEILEKLGTPDNISESQLGPVARYRFLDEKYFRVSFSWALRFIIPLFTIPGTSPDMSLAAGGIGTDEFAVVFDANWVVQYQAFALHSGASQFRAIPFDVPSKDPAEIPVSF